MTSALAFKELREIRGLAVLGLLALLFIAGANMGSPMLLMFFGFDGSTIPLVSDQFGTEFYFACGLLAIALGLRQSLGDFSGGAHLFLLHRPMSRGQMYGTKLLVGLGVLLACGGLVVGLYTWWAATPGNHASPFEWSMTNGLWLSCLAMTGIYLGAFLTGIRPGRWFGTRLAPLAASLALVLISSAPPLVAAVPMLLAVDALLIAGILATVKTREFG